jgi:dipeptidase D
MDIHKGLGNANKLLTRLLLSVEDTGFSVSTIDGGGLRNAIPREAFAELSVDDATVIKERLAFAKTVLLAEYASTDPGFEITIENIDTPAKVLSAAFQKQILRALQATPNGIWRMSPDVPGLVQTSNNLARVLVAAGKYQILCLTRSSVDTEKYDEVAAIRSVYELIGAEVSTDGDYPGWTPLPQSTLLSTMRDLYVERFGEEPEVSAGHAGLECGIIGEKNAGMEMISFGPNIRGAHSPDERVQISSVQKFWGYFVDALARL